MVFAQGEDLDVLDYHQFVVVFVEDSAIHDIAQIFFVAFGEEQHRLGITFGCVEETLAVRVFAYAFEDCADRPR